MIALRDALKVPLSENQNGAGEYVSLLMSMKTGFWWLQ